MSEQEPTRSGSQVQPKQLAPVAVVSAAITVWLAALGLITTPYMLHRLGVSQVRVASNVREALRAIEERAPAFALLVEALRHSG